MMSYTPDLADPIQDNSSCQSKEADTSKLHFAVKSRPTSVQKRTPSRSPTSNPSKKPRRLLRLSPSAPTTPTERGTTSKSPVLRLLESKKKAPRSGLYEWVLWREALKGEFERSPGSSSQSRDSSTLRERSRVYRNLNKSFTS